MERLLSIEPVPMTSADFKIRFPPAKFEEHGVFVGEVDEDLVYPLALKFHEALVHVPIPLWRPINFGYFSNEVIGRYECAAPFTFDTIALFDTCVNQLRSRRRYNYISSTFMFTVPHTARQADHSDFKHSTEREIAISRGAISTIVAGLERFNIIVSPRLGEFVYGEDLRPRIAEPILLTLEKCQFITMDGLTCHAGAGTSAKPSVGRFFYYGGESNVRLPDKRKVFVFP